MVINMRQPLEEIVKSYIEFQTETQVTTFPMVYEQVMKDFKQRYEPWERQGRHPRDVAIELLYELHIVYGYTLRYDEKIHGDEYI